MPSIRSAEDTLTITEPKPRLSTCQDHSSQEGGSQETLSRLSSRASLKSRLSSRLFSSKAGLLTPVTGLHRVSSGSRVHFADEVVTEEPDVSTKTNCARRLLARYLGSSAERDLRRTQLEFLQSPLPPSSFVAGFKSPLYELLYLEWLHAAAFKDIEREVAALRLPLHLVILLCSTLTLAECVLEDSQWPKLYLVWLFKFLAQTAAALAATCASRMTSVSGRAASLLSFVTLNIHFACCLVDLAMECLVRPANVQGLSLFFLLLSAGPLVSCRLLPALAAALLWITAATIVMARLNAPHELVAAYLGAWLLFAGSFTLPFTW